MASLSFDGGGQFDIAPSVPATGGALQSRGGGSFRLFPATASGGALAFDGSGNFLLSQGSQAGGVLAFDGAGDFLLHNPTPAGGSFSFDGGGAFLLHNEASSSWSFDIENTDTDDGTFPVLTLLLSLSNVLETPVWFQPPGRPLKGFTVTRGKSGEFDDFPPGTGSLTLDNKGGLFDPENQASPLAPYLTTNRHVRVVATRAGVDHVVLDQYVDFWPTNDDPTFVAREITVTTTDATILLANRSISPARPWTLDDPDLGPLDANNRLAGQPSFEATFAGIRIRQILDLIGWPDELTDVDDGLTQVVADEPTDKALLYMQRLARSDMGQLFITAANVLTFRERRAWTRIAEQRVAQITFSDNPDLLPGLPYSDIAVDPGTRSLIKNKATRTSAGEITFTAIDVDSANTYGELVDEQTDLLAANYSDIVAQCQYVVARWADGVLRVTGLTADGIEQPDEFFPFVLAAEIGWRVIAARTPAIGGAPVPHDCAIEQITHTVVAPKSWETTFGLVEADLTPYFTLDVSKLDGDSVLAY